MKDNATAAQSIHRWWHDGRGYKHAFCLFCGTPYEYGTRPWSQDETPCLSPLAAGGEEQAQRILKEARRV